MKFSFKFAFIVTTLMIAGQMASAASESSVSTSVKPVRKFGGTIGLGSPYPGLLGVNLSYNMNEDWRAIAGYSEIEVSSGFGPYSETVKGTTVALGIQKAFTDWAVRPVAGLHAGYFKISGPEGSELEISGFDKSTALAYSNLGIDWIANSGFNLGTGMNVAVAGGSGASFYANIGKFF